jgi:pyruvate dehydrogenase E2 component (dihydrolipoamide acetyltransferase)
MPSLGADMEQGLFVDWLIKPGEHVERGQVVCVVETQKGAVDVEIWDSGTVESLVAVPGQTIPVGGLMALIRADGEQAEAEPAPNAGKAPGHDPKLARKPVATRGTRPIAGVAGRARPDAPAAPQAVTGGRVWISPAARKRAVEIGVDPADVVGTGPDGAITLADIEQFTKKSGLPAAATKRAPADAESRKQAMREAIATAMARSNREIPHYHLGSLIKVEPALTWLQARNADVAVEDRVIFPVLQLRAVALALREVPALNGWYRDDRFSPAESIHLGVAIALRGGGLVAPALRDADRLSMADMMEALRDLLQRARSGQLRSSELTETSLTVTNLGDLGVDSVYGVIYPPQVALVGFGRISERPWAEDGKLFSARCLHVSLSADHRVSDGAIGARFLSRITAYLTEPESLWEN